MVLYLLFRKLCEVVEPSAFGCTPLQWSPRKPTSEISSPSGNSSVFRTPVRGNGGDLSSGYESMLSLDSSQETLVDAANGLLLLEHQQTPVRPEKPKRRWLREALTSVQPDNANLTRPSVIMTAPKQLEVQPAIVPLTPGSPAFHPSSTSTPAKPPSEDTNTSSLIRALQNAEKQWTGAIALMQLASSPH